MGYFGKTIQSNYAAGQVSGNHTILHYGEPTSGQSNLPDLRDSWPSCCVSQNIRGTVGLPTPGMHLRVVDPESLQDVSDGTAGLILAKGPGVTAGYWANEKTTAEAFRAGDGWYDTGEVLPG